MKVKFTKDVGHAKAGAVEEYPTTKALRLISSGKAVAYEQVVVPDEAPVDEEAKPVVNKKSKKQGVNKHV